MGQGRQRRELLRRAGELAEAARKLVEEQRSAAAAVGGPAAELVAAGTGQRLDRMPVTLLEEAVGGQIRTDALRGAGYASVGAVHRAVVTDLLRVPGVGRTTAERAKAAADRMAEETARSAAVRLDPDAPTATQTRLLEALHPFVEGGPGLSRIHEQAGETLSALEPLLAAAAPARGRLRLRLSSREKREAALAALDGLAARLAAADAGSDREAFLQAATDLLRRPGGPDEAWLEFRIRSAEYYTALGQLTEDAARDRRSAEGHVPAELAEQVRAQELETLGLTLSLRGYQEFGARYALARRRVVLGDEMGLGKTVQAIAVMNHLRAQGRRRFLVVCPASVLVNWIREVHRCSGLAAHRLHGSGRERAAWDWAGLGGVAVTTYQGLAWLESDGPSVPFDLLVVDEAHLVKNPAAQRSQRVAALAGRTERVLFLTGTALENHVGEFRTLIGYLQPELLDVLGTFAVHDLARPFRHAVAPVYLRRNQADVLTELPELVRVDEWAEPSTADRAALREAAAARNFQALRRAAYTAPDSAKLARLRELIAQAAQDGEKVLVFSAFHEVLTTVQAALEAAGSAQVFGPLTGAVDADARQETVDRFTVHEGPAVLLAQIEALGLGLNLQAASVVVLTEPQTKPGLEAQAAARAHRMGQLRRVRVHRLLTPDSVDQRLLALMERKSQDFDAYARRSEAAEADPAARDVTDAETIRRLLEEEELRFAAAP